MKRRIQKVLLVSMIIFICGIVYYIWIRQTRLAIPCIFHVITGLDCPGCGVSRMCIALLQLDFHTAYHSNKMLFLLLPILCFLLLQSLFFYIVTGEKKLKKAQSYTIYLCAVLLVLFGIFRNIAYFDFITK